MKHTIVALIVLLLIAGGLYYFIQSMPNRTADTTPPPGADEQTDDTPMPVEPDGGIGDGAEPLPDVIEELPDETVIGNSIKGNPITAYHFGTGERDVLFVGGIHGGYSWNTALLAYELIDYLEANPDAVPENVRVSVVPVMNPDGLELITGSTGRFEPSDVSGNTVLGRFNANDVDLNRNFDCEWAAEGTWRSETVSGGAEPFSEPESRAMRTFVRELEPEAAVVWYSAAGGVYSSSCNNGVASETTELTNEYAEAASYEAFEEFDFYEITGDMVNWMAKEDIPAISVLLTTHTETEWEKNRAGAMATLEFAAE